MIEGQPIEIINSNPNVCDKQRYDELHQPRLGEPFSKLTGDDRHGYFNLLTKLGVPELDALEATRKLKQSLRHTSETEGQNTQNHEEIQARKSAVVTVKTVLQDLTDFIRTPGIEARGSTLGEAIPVGQEITLYSIK